MRISDDTLAQAHEGNIDPIWPPIVCLFFFLLNFTRILWFLFWDLVLTLFDIPKDAVFGEILDFSNIFGFPATNWAPNRTKSVDVQFVPLEQNFKILRDFSINLFVLLGCLWSKFQDWTLFEGTRVKKKQKRVIS